jgi:hypothetical protein
MQDSVGTGGDTLDANLSGAWMEQSEQFGGSVLRIFMGLLAWLSLWLPVITRIGNRLIGSRFVLRPNR